MGSNLLDSVSVSLSGLVMGGMVLRLRHFSRLLVLVDFGHGFL